MWFESLQQKQEGAVEFYGVEGQDDDTALGEGVIEPWRCFSITLTNYGFYDRVARIGLI